MPFEMQVAGSILRITCSGIVSKAEFVDVLEELRRFESKFECVPDRLTDLSGIAGWEPDFAATMEVTNRRRAEVFPNKFKSAIVAPTPMTYGVARMFQTLNDNPQIEIRIFKARADAEEWLA